MERLTALPEPIATELWDKLNQAHGIVHLAQSTTETQLSGDIESALAASLEAALSLLIDARSLVDKCR